MDLQPNSQLEEEKEKNFFEEQREQRTKSSLQDTDWLRVTIEMANYFLQEDLKETQNPSMIVWPLHQKLEKSGHSNPKILILIKNARRIKKTKGTPKNESIIRS